MKTIFRLLILMTLSLFLVPIEAQAGVFEPVPDGIYGGNMTLIAQVKQNGNPVANAELGVFAGDECRAACIADADGMVYPVILGEDPVTLTFKVAISGAIYSATPSQTVEFQTGAYIGSESPVIITVGSAVPTDIDNSQCATHNAQCTKELRNGQVLILRDGKTLDILGNEIH